MVLEALTNPVSAEKRPLQMVILGFIYASIAMYLSLWIFYEYSSLVMVFLTVFASIPIVYNTIKLEERKDEREDDEVTLLKEHWKAVEVFLFLFVGYSVAYGVWFVFLEPFIALWNNITPQFSFINLDITLPESPVGTLFRTQTETFYNLNAGVVGMAAHLGQFAKILLNNLKVLIFCIMFSLIYGLGAIFILAWNASVIGAAIGVYITENLQKVAASSLVTKIGAHIQILTYGFLKYSLHGFFEIGAYFVGGLAGGILSIAVMRQNFGSKKFELILVDSADMMMLAVVTLIFAAVLEVWVTPIIF